MQVEKFTGFENSMLCSGCHFVLTTLDNVTFIFATLLFVFIPFVLNIFVVAALGNIIFVYLIYFFCCPDIEWVGDQLEENESEKLEQNDTNFLEISYTNTC
jgi:predicted membrane protein